MVEYNSNELIISHVMNTPKNEIAIHKGDTFKCDVCKTKYYFSKDINGKSLNQIYNNLHRAHALDCPTYKTQNHNAGINNAIRKANMNFISTRQRIYDGNRYRVSVLNHNMNTIIDKSTGGVYNAFYENRKLVIMNVL